MKITVAILAAVIVAAFSSAATPESNALLAQQLFQPATQTIIDANSQRVALLTRIAEIKSQQDFQRQQMAQQQANAVEMENLRASNAKTAEEAKVSSAIPAPAPVVPAKPVTLDDILSAIDQESAGIGKLTTAERENLANTLLNKLRMAYGIGLTQAAKGAVALHATAPQQPQRYVSLGGGHWVKGNIESGNFIQLEDGSLWQINPLNKLDASLWLATSTIVVLDDDKGSPEYAYRLVNTDDKETAQAKLVSVQ